jgi:atrazine chlorohydrolase/5-methylthioadenosine/S-adenosylhomocysteine deaminase/melamine deaminase
VTATAYLGGHVLTMDEAATEHPVGVVVVEDDRIVAVGDAGDLDGRTGVEVVDCTGCLVLPGFVNAHTHASQTLLRGGPNHSRGLYDWLLNVVVPGLAAYRPGDLRTAVELYAYESILAGVTTVVANEEPLGSDPEASAREVLDAFDRSGLRTRYAHLFRDRAPEAVGREKGVSEAAELPAHESVDSVLDLVERLAEEYAARTGGLVDVWPSPATTAVVSDEGLRKAADLARRRGGRWALHLAEIPLEGELRGYSPVRHLEKLELLSARLLAAHCVHVDDDDIQRLSESGVGVVTNPVSNCFLASGIAPVPALLAAGALVAFGTDDANVNDSVNPLSDLKVAALLHRAATSDAAAVSPEALVRAATVDGARALGLADVGTLAPGMQADLQVVSMQLPHLVPSHDPYATLVFQTLGHEVRDVVVAGRPLMRDRRVTSVAAPELLTRAQEASTRILTQAGIRPRRARGNEEKR